MARVLVPVGLDDTGYNKGFGEINFVRTAYLLKLVRYGITPIIVSPYCTPPMIDDLYAMCDGVMLMGGADIDARMYSEENHPKNILASPKRDEIEKELVERAIEDRKPILAICRGCQMLAVATGGSLHQHVPDLVPNEEHGVGESCSYEKDLTTIFHDVLIEPGSKARKLIGADTVRTNSSHHQCVKQPGRGLKVAGRTSAGVIELLEHEDPSYFCFGIQSHPEVMEESFFEQFFSAFSKALSVSSSMPERSDLAS